MFEVADTLRSVSSLSIAAPSSIPVDKLSFDLPVFRRVCAAEQSEICQPRAAIVECRFQRLHDAVCGRWKMRLLSSPDGM